MAIPKVTIEIVTPPTTTIAATDLLDREAEVEVELARVRIITPVVILRAKATRLEETNEGGRGRRRRGGSAGQGNNNNSSNNKNFRGNSGNKNRSSGGNNNNNNGGRNRKRHSDPVEFDDVDLVDGVGMLEMHPNGYGFLRSPENNFFA